MPMFKDSKRVAGGGLGIEAVPKEGFAREGGNLLLHGIESADAKTSRAHRK